MWWRKKQKEIIELKSADEILHQSAVKAAYHYEQYKIQYLNELYDAIRWASDNGDYSIELPTLWRWDTIERRKFTLEVYKLLKQKGYRLKIIKKPFPGISAYYYDDINGNKFYYYRKVTIHWRKK